MPACLPVPTLPARSSQLCSEPAQALSAAGSGPQCWCQKQNREWESREAQTGRSCRGCRPRGPLLLSSLPSILRSHGGGGVAEDWGWGGGDRGKPLASCRGDRSRLGLRTHPPGIQMLHPHPEQPRTSGLVQRRLTPSLRNYPRQSKRVLGSCVVFRVVSGILRERCETGTHQPASELHNSTVEQ